MALGGIVYPDFAIGASVLDALVFYDSKNIGFEAIFPVGRVGLQEGVARVDRILRDGRLRLWSLLVCLLS